VIFACDCATADPAVWLLPSEARDLTLAQSGDTTTLAWTPPAYPGATSLVYDTLRSDTPDGFVSGVVCIESNEGTDTLAYDEETPAPGSAFFYLVRAAHACGPGSLGTATGGPRAGAECP